MNKEEHRRDLYKIGRSWLIIMILFFLINTIGVMYLIGNEDFLFWFNLTCFLGTIIFLSWLDHNSFKLIRGLK